VQFRKDIPVGMVVEHGTVTKAHPSIGKVKGKSIEKAKQIIKGKKGKITKVR